MRMFRRVSFWVTVSVPNRKVTRSILQPARTENVMPRDA
jgi:hypothetical protein